MIPTSYSGYHGTRLKYKISVRSTYAFVKYTSPPPISQPIDRLSAVSSDTCWYPHTPQGTVTVCYGKLPKVPCVLLSEWQPWRQNILAIHQPRSVRTLSSATAFSVQLTHHPLVFTYRLQLWRRQSDQLLSNLDLDYRIDRKRAMTETISPMHRVDSRSISKSQMPRSRLLR